MRCLVVPVAVALACASAPAALAGGILPGRNPAANIAPSPDFLASGQCTSDGSGYSCANPCVTSQLSFPADANTPSCAKYILVAIDAARRDERAGPMVLPSNWYSLTPQEQLFVVADLERTARGLPPYLGLNAALSADAQRAANGDTDPGVAAGFAIATDPEGDEAMGGAWAFGFSVLGADYEWMYDDGWGGSVGATSNSLCTSPTAPACWAHRDELLGYDPGFNPGVGLRCGDCEMGTGYASTDGYGSFTDVVEKPLGKAPAMTFTWARDVRPFLGHRAATHSAPKPPTHTKIRAARSLELGTWAIAPYARHLCKGLHATGAAACTGGPKTGLRDADRAALSPGTRPRARGRTHVESPIHEGAR